MMDATLGYILCSQSPTLFLAAVVLLLCYFARRRSHHARAVLDWCCALCAPLPVWHCTSSAWAGDTLPSAISM